jgi:hypothetical protein
MTRSARVRHGIIAFLGIVLFATASSAATLWEQANANKDLLRISTLFTAQNVRDHLGSDDGIDTAIAWCKATGVTHAFIETFRGNYTVPRPLLERAKLRFTEASFDVSGCVTTTRVGKRSTGWEIIDCYTDISTQQHLQQIFQFTASIFDEIMIDDFLFTDCECDACQKARGDQSWAEYRCDLMVKASRDRILKPARAVNPNAKVIIKYPQWYSNFHNRGYDVARQSADYDRIWVGTETRDYADERWGGKVQYEAYYIMRWLGEIGGAKCGGGWFDPYGTHEDTYVEQARQTVLADAKEMLLFCYGSLQENTGPANVARLRTEIPGLFELAKLVRNRPLRGIAAPKPPNSNPGKESYVYDFVGMMGLPLVPTATIRSDAKAAFLPVQALKDPQLGSKLGALLRAGAPVLVTDGLAQELPAQLAGDDHLLVLNVGGNPKGLLELTREELKPIRDKLLAPFGLRFDAPNKVALYLIGDKVIIVENFNDEPVTATLEFAQLHTARQVLSLPADAKVELSASAGKVEFQTLPPRTLVALTH